MRSQTVKIKMAVRGSRRMARAKANRIKRETTRKKTNPPIGRTGKRRAKRRTNKESKEARKISPLATPRKPPRRSRRGRGRSRRRRGRTPRETESFNHPSPFNTLNRTTEGLNPTDPTDRTKLLKRH